MQRLQAQAIPALRLQFDHAIDPAVRAASALTLGDHYFYIVQDSAAYYFTAAKKIIPTTGYDSLYIRLYERSSIFNELYGNISQSLEDIRTAHTRVKISGRQKSVDQMYTLLGRYHMRALNYDSAAYYWNLLIKSKEEKGDLYGHWLPYHYLGVMYSDLGEWAKAKAFLLKALDYARLEKRPMDYPFLLYIVIQQCNIWKEHDLYSDLKNEYLLYKQSRGQNILTPEHSTLQDLEASPADRRKQILKYLPYHLKNANNISTCESYFQLGETYMEEKNYNEAIATLLKMLPLSDSLRMPALTYNMHDALYRAYRAAHKFPQAIEHHEIMLVLRDSVMNIERQNQMNEMLVKYETIEKEKQLAETTLHLATSKKKQQFLGFGLLGAVMISGFIFYAFRTKRKSNLLLEEKNRTITKALQEKDILLREIHHRVKNNLQMISALLYLHGKSVDDTSAQEALMESQNRVQSMAMIHQNLYQNENLLGVSIQAYLDKLLTHLISAYNIEKERIQIIKQIDIPQLDVDTVIPLALIINELVSNALKYAFKDGRKGEIKIVLQAKGELIHLEVKDNGMGLPDHFAFETSTNFGLKLINILCDRLGATWAAESGNGTRITLSIPFKKAA